MLRKAPAITALMAALTLVVTAADAHPRLRSASPASGAMLRAAPTEIRMKFSEGLIARFTGLQLKDSQGRLVPTGAPMLGANDNTRLVVPIQTRLAAGAYRVDWHAVSVDTHRVSGSYSFKVVR